MTPAQLERIGQALFGKQWQTNMARLWDISDRTVRNWAAGKGGPNPGHLAELRDHVRQKIAMLQDVMIELEAADDDPGV